MFDASSLGMYLWLPQIVKAIGFSNTTTGFIVALCFVASIPAMILCGRSSSRRDERVWHVGLSWLLAGASVAAASLVQSNAVILAALATGLAGQYAPFGPFFSLPSSFLRGRAAAGAIGLIGTFGNFGSFLGPVLIGVLVQGSGDYASSFRVIALGYAASGLIVLAVGRAMAMREVKIAAPA